MKLLPTQVKLSFKEYRSLDKKFKNSFKIKLKKIFKQLKLKS